jgi:hypothetical protein
LFRPVLINLLCASENHRYRVYPLCIVPSVHFCFFCRLFNHFMQLPTRVFVAVMPVQADVSYAGAGQLSAVGGQLFASHHHHTAETGLRHLLCSGPSRLPRSTRDALPNGDGYVMAQFLPLELVEEILKNFVKDKATLRACALSCRAWLSASQQCIFHTISVTNSSDCDSIVSLLQDCSHIRPLIIKLVWRTSSKFLPSNMAAGLFPRVRYLRYDSETLHWSFVSSLPALETLNLGAHTDISDSYDSASQTTSHSDTIPLRHLFLKHRDDLVRKCAGVPTWIVPRVHADVLRTLDLRMPSFKRGNMPILRQFLSSLTALRELILRISIRLSSIGEVAVAWMSQHMLILCDRLEPRHCSSNQTTPECLPRPRICACDIWTSAPDPLPGTTPPRSQATH